MPALTGAKTLAPLFFIEISKVRNDGSRRYFNRAATSSIDAELTEFGVNLQKDESGEFLLTSDKDIVYLQKIVDTHYKGIAEVVCTTKLIMPLTPSPNSFDRNSFSNDLPEDAQVTTHGKHFVITSKRPLDTELSIFKKLRFASCMISVAPKQIDTNIEIAIAEFKK